MSRLLVLAIGLVIVASGCGSHADGRVSGTLRMEGGLMVDRAVPGTVTVVDETGHHSSIETSASGEFDLKLRVGTYVLSGQSPLINDGRYPCAEPTRVVVTRNRTATVKLICPIR